VQELIAAARRFCAAFRTGNLRHASPSLSAFPGCLFYFFPLAGLGVGEFPMGARQLQRLIHSLMWVYDLGACEEMRNRISRS
jgi:hypothetical protein